MTARELIQALLLNVNLDDHVEVEVKHRPEDTHAFNSYDAVRVTRINEEKTALIECYDNE